MESIHQEFANGGFTDYFKDFLTLEEAGALFTHLKNNINWEQKTYKNFRTGKDYPQPRLTAWFADNKFMEYSYSGITQIVQEWIHELIQIKDKIENLTNNKYNSVLLNYYRDGMDSVGLHADNEKELGVNPNIASISLGETRKFILKQNYFKGCKGFLETYEFDLENGSLLIMGGTLQHHYKHEVPKEKDKGPRINLTFRKII